MPSGAGLVGQEYSTALNSGGEFWCTASRTSAGPRRDLRVRCLDRSELANGGFKDASVEIDVGLGCVRRHERHIVEGREQNAAIERVEMHEALQIKIGRGSGFFALARRVRTKKILAAAAPGGYLPRQSA